MAAAVPPPKLAAGVKKFPLNGPVFVFKPGKLGGGKWKMRYCTLQAGLLMYSRDKKPNVTLLLERANVVCPKQAESGAPGENVVEVRSPRGDCWRLCFSSSPQRDEWTEALKTASEPGAASSGGGPGEKTVPQTPGMPVDLIPTRFMVGCNNDLVEASRRWRITHQWRAENDMDNILYEPFGDHVDFMKEAYRHFFHKRAKNGHVVYYERMNPSSYQSLVDRVGKERLVRYYMMISEYCYEELETSDPGGRMVNVYDLSHITFAALFGQSCDMAKKVVQLCAAHYPERADKVFIINAPKFFTTLWNMIAPLLDPRTRAKINIATDDRTALLEYIEEDCVPIEYGGKDPTPIGQAKEELMFMAWLNKHCTTRNGARPPAVHAPASAVHAPDSAPKAGGGTSSLLTGKAGAIAVVAVVWLVVRNLFDVRAFICARVCDH